MSEKDLYQKLLGLPVDWKVINVEINFVEQKVEVFIANKAQTKYRCPECQELCSVYDHREHRYWRHLDTMQFKTYIHASLPRVNCKKHGKLTIDVSWGDKYARFTKLFETLAIDLLLASKNKTAIADILGLSWDEIDHIMQKAVERGLARREEFSSELVGVDEKSFKKGHKYVTLLYDLDECCVIDVAEDRTEQSLTNILSQLNENEKKSIKAVSADMWEPFTKAINQVLHDAKIVYDKYHIISHINKAINKVRIEENKALISKQIKTLKNTKYLWLKNKKNMTNKQADLFHELYHLGLKVASAWNIREFIKYLWGFSNVKIAKTFFDIWHKEVLNTKLLPMIKVADMIKSKLNNILTFIEFPITNALAEGLNSKIQNIIYTARGFRGFKTFRTSILFYCGNLQLYPQ
jgi:transposase